MAGTYLINHSVQLTISKSKNMYIAVNHKISNPENFWTSAQASLPELPVAGVKRIINVFPAPDNTEATCIWEADSIDQLNTYLRSKVHDWSQETYHEINAAAAMGLVV